MMFFRHHMLEKLEKCFHLSKNIYFSIFLYFVMKYIYELTRSDFCDTKWPRMRMNLDMIYESGIVMGYLCWVIGK